MRLPDPISWWSLLPVQAAPLASSGKRADRWGSPRAVAGSGQAGSRRRVRPRRRAECGATRTSLLQLATDGRCARRGWPVLRAAGCVVMARLLRCPPGLGRARDRSREWPGGTLGPVAAVRRDSRTPLGNPHHRAARHRARGSQRVASLTLAAQRRLRERDSGVVRGGLGQSRVVAGWLAAAGSPYLHVAGKATSNCRGAAGTAVVVAGAGRRVPGGGIPQLAGAASLRSSGSDRGRGSDPEIALFGSRAAARGGPAARGRGFSDIVPPRAGGQRCRSGGDLCRCRRPVPAARCDPAQAMAWLCWGSFPS